MRQLPMTQPLPTVKRVFVPGRDKPNNRRFAPRKRRRGQDLTTVCRLEGPWGLYLAATLHCQPIMAVAPEPCAGLRVIDLPFFMTRRSQGLCGLTTFSVVPRPGISDSFLNPGGIDVGELRFS